MTIESRIITAAAERLRESHRTSLPCAPIRDLVGLTDLDTAYAVQEHNTRYWLTEGRRLVGRKIGLTAKSVQQQLGVDEPDYGMLFADMAVADGEAVATPRLMQPRVEGGIAFVLKRGLPATPLTMADVIGAVDYALPAIEIVGSRIAGWDIKITDTVADNASSGLFVLGNQPRGLADFDARLCGMVLERRGEQVSLGAGAACLGNPLNALLWLARKMALCRRPLEAGDIALSGALGPRVTAVAGDVFELRINGLGSVRAVFS